jgi:hypothetical protein
LNVSVSVSVQRSPDWPWQAVRRLAVRPATFARLTTAWPAAAVTTAVGAAPAVAAPARLWAVTATVSRAPMLVAVTM